MCEQAFLRDLQHCKFYTGGLNRNALNFHSYSATGIFALIILMLTVLFMSFTLHFPTRKTVLSSLKEKKKKEKEKEVSLFLIAQWLVCCTMVFSPQRALLCL